MSSKSKFNIKDSVNNATQKFYNLSKQIMSDRSNLGTTLIWIVIVLLFILFVVYVHNVKYSLQYKRCGTSCSGANTNCNLSTIYTRNSEFASSLSPINKNSPQCLFFLRDYYILTAFNCCSGGNYKNDYVGLCNLIAVISQGVRCLDFEVYSLNNQPVVATSSSPMYSTCYKESYNSIPFGDVMTTIESYAYSNSTCPNPTDPIIMHLRIKSANCTMLDNLADVLEKFDVLLLGPTFSYEFNGNNLGSVPLLTFSGVNNPSKQGKIIIIVDQMTNGIITAIMNSKMWEYVNMVSGSTFMQIVPNSTLESESDLNNFIQYNMTNMSMVIPDSGSNPANPNFLLSQLTGCQMCAMRWQLPDINLQLCTTSCISTSIDPTTNTNTTGVNTCFNSAGFAFVLKPSNLRYIPTTYDVSSADPSLSYAPMIQTTQTGVPNTSFTYNY
jgi:hypothetical protein